MIQFYSDMGAAPPVAIISPLISESATVAGTENMADGIGGCSRFVFPALDLHTEAISTVFSSSDEEEDEDDALDLAMEQKEASPKPLSAIDLEDVEDSILEEEVEDDEAGLDGISSSPNPDSMERLFLATSSSAAAAALVTLGTSTGLESVLMSCGGAALWQAEGVTSSSGPIIVLEVPFSASAALTSASQGCARISSRVILLPTSTSRQRRMRSWHSVERRSSVRKWTLARLICESVSKGMSPLTMS